MRIYIYPNYNYTERKVFSLFVNVYFFQGVSVAIQGERGNAASVLGLIATGQF